MSLLAHKTPPSFLHTLHHRFRNSHKYHHRRSSIYSYRFPPALTVSSSLFASANAIVAASGSSGSAVHGAVTSAITQVAVTAVAIASGACLSTKVDFLWPKLEEEQPGSFILEGVDVTGCPIFCDAKAGAKGYCICEKSSPWTITEDRRSLFNSLYSYWKSLGNVGSIKWQTKQGSCIKRCQGGATQVCKKYTIKNNLKQKVEEEGTIGKEN